IMQMLYCFVNNIHVDYAELLWEGKSKNVVGMKISDWMITDEIKLTDNYRLYAEVFGVDVPMTQSQPIESTQGMHRTTSALKTPNLEKFNALAKNLKDIMMESLLKLVDGRIKKILQTQVPLHVTQEIILEREQSQAEVAKMIVDAIQLIDRSGVICQDMYFICTPLKLHQLLHMNNNNINYIDYKDNSQLQHDDLPIWLNLKYKFERLYMATNPCRPSNVRYRYQDDPHDDAYSEGKNSAKRQKTYKDETFVFGESSSRQDYESERDDDVLLNEKVSQELMDEMSQTVDEAKLQSDYKNLNKNDFEDMYMLIINHKVDDYAKTGLLWSLSVFIRSTMIWKRVYDFQLGVESYQQQVNLTVPTITFPGIKKYKVFFIVSEPVYGIICKNNKKENRVMRHQEVHKFCDATLKRVLEELNSYNNDVKYGYVTHNLSKEDVEYLQLFAKEIEERLKYRDQMRRWEIYINERPLGSRMERPE
nr:hypothetical protein [Tanacetum cinerariifolium]